MAENSGIEWTHHTLLDGGPERQAEGVNKPMAVFAERDAVGQIGPHVGMFCKLSNMMRVEVAAAIVSTMTTGEAVAKHHIKAPTLVFVSQPLASSFDAATIDVSRGIRPTRSNLPNRGADLRACFGGVLLADPVARPRFGRSTHLGATFGRHRLPLHRGSEGRAARCPRLFHNFTAGQSHG